MKKNLLRFLSIAIFGMVMFTSCVDDPCANLDCGVGGDCFDGDCVCQVGFTKDANGDCVEACSLVNCGDNSTCIDGDCICDIGFEEDADGNCVSENMKYMGTWNVQDDCDPSGMATYSVSISAAPDSTQVAINDFYELFDRPVFADVIGTSITIARQDPLGTGIFFVEGSGSYDSDQIIWTYTVSDETPGDPFTDTCTSTWSK